MNNWLFGGREGSMLVMSKIRQRVTESNNLVVRESSAEIKLLRSLFDELRGLSNDFLKLKQYPINARLDSVEERCRLALTLLQRLKKMDVNSEHVHTLLQEYMRNSKSIEEAVKEHEEYVRHRTRLPN